MLVWLLQMHAHRTKMLEDRKKSLRVRFEAQGVITIRPRVVASFKKKVDKCYVYRHLET